MKASIEWLNEFSDINVKPEDLIEILTLTGTKVETLERKGNDIKNVVVGKILEIKPHVDADKLVVCQVDVGTDVIQIVTGAKNVKQGDIIPVCKNGSKLPGGKEIKSGMLRGVLSDGMLASIGELGLTLSDYPDQIEDGIMILDKSYEDKLGQDIVDVLDLREDIFDFEITPNRVDCFGVEGIGREVAVSLDEDFKDPNKKLDNIKPEKKDEIDGLRVEVLDSELCPRYIARVVKNVRIKESPMWLKRRLKALGVRSINNIVDITNYVMLEMGQPMHAFDIDNIEGRKIIVRPAKDGEKLTTLDGNEKILDSEDIVICDEKKPIGLAGVMGGLNSEITDDTKTLVFEAAVFKRGNIRLTSKRHNLRTESSSRFEKGLSPENALRAINRACELIEILDAGDVIDEVIDVYGKKQEESKVVLDIDKINRLNGTNLSYEYITDVLKKLEFKIEKQENDTIVTAPYFRLDIESNADLAEEVLRIYGYDKLESSILNSSVTIGMRNKEQNIHFELENFLRLNGFSEIYTYGFINENEIIKSGLPQEILENKIEIINPLSEDYKLMRPSTIPSILKILKLNLNKKNKDVKLFDISRIYLDKDKKIQDGEIPDQEMILTLGLYGKDINFFVLKGYIENILENINISSYQLRKEKNNNSYHPGRCANIQIGNDTIATFGQVHPQVSENYDINCDSYIAQINLTKIAKYSKNAKKYQEIAKYPAVNRDLSLVVDESVTIAEIENIILKISKKYIEEIKLFDIYRSEKIGENKKSVSFNLQFRDKNKTLSDDEINDLMKKIIDQLQNQVNASLR